MSNHRKKIRKAYSKGYAQGQSDEYEQWMAREPGDVTRGLIDNDLRGRFGFDVLAEVPEIFRVSLVDVLTVVNGDAFAASVQQYSDGYDDGIRELDLILQYSDSNDEVVRRARKLVERVLPRETSNG